MTSTTDAARRAFKWTITVFYCECEKNKTFVIFFSSDLIIRISAYSLVSNF